MEDKKALVETKAKEVAIFDDDLGFSGFEGADNDAGSFATPFLKVLQALSPALDDTDDAYIEGAVKGEFYNTVTGETYGRNMNLVIVYTERVFNEYKPNRGGFVGTYNKTEGEALIRDKGEYPYVNKKTGNNLVETLTFYLLNADDISSGPIIFPLSSTSLKHGKTFLSKASMLKLENGKRAPLYSSIYNFETKQQENENGKWFQVVKSSIKRVGSISKEQKVAVASAYNLFKTEGIDYAKNEEPKQNDLDFGDDNDNEDKPF